MAKKLNVSNTLSVVAIIGATYFLLIHKKKATIGSVLFNENKRVQVFISEWSTKNPYKNNLLAHNKKFKNDFNNFLQSGNFSQETINTYRIV